MATRSIIDVDVDPDDNFKAFSALFEKYEAQLAKMPQAWAAVSKETRSSFEAVTAALLSQNELNRRNAAAAKQGSAATKDTARAWDDIGKHTKTALGNIKEATTSLLKWTALTTVFSGILGAGGLFGIDRLAASVSASRRSAQGLGLTVGEQKSFGIDFSRLVGSDQFIGGVNEALHDVTKRYTLYGAGLNESELTGKDTGQVAVEALTSIKAILDRTPDNQIAQVLQARGLGQFLSLNDAQRLKQTSPAELADFIRQQETDKKTLEIQQQTQKAWQDLSVQLSLAGAQIENVFVKGLAPLAGPLKDVSKSFVDVIQSLLANPNLKGWIEDISHSLEDFAKYVGTDQFRVDMKNFADGFIYLATKVTGIAKSLGFVAGNAESIGIGAGVGAAVGAFTPVGPMGGAAVGAAVGAGIGATNTAVGNSIESQSKQGYFVDPFSGAIVPTPPLAQPPVAPSPANTNVGSSAGSNPSNPGNMRMPGQKTGFATFPNADAGVAAVARQLRIDEQRHGLTTIAQIIGDPKHGYAPAADHNDVAAYVKDVSAKTGYGPNDKLDLTNQAVLAKLTSAILQHEKKGNAGYTPAVVSVIISDSTGANTIVRTAQVAQ